MENGRYTSPKMNFSCTVPELLQPGATIRDGVAPETGTVTFEDDMGTLKRVDYFIIPAGKEKDIETLEGRKNVQNYLFNYVVEQLYRSVVRDAKIVHTEFIELPNPTRDRTETALYGIALLPKGSTLAERTKGRYDALRASLVFFKGQFSYVLTIQNIPGLFADLRTKPISDEERKKQLLEDLEKFYETFSFN